MMRRIGQGIILTLAAGAALALGIPAAAMAGTVPVETSVLGQSRVTLHVYPFLDKTELATLRMVMTNPSALALFLPKNGPKNGAGGYAAIAVAPGEGFIRGGKPVSSAVALGGLPNAKTADAEATHACDTRRKPGGAPCVVVLDVAPKG